MGTEPIQAGALRYRFGVRPGGTHQVILALIPERCTVLDVGCASGYLGAELSRRGCHVWGVDADRFALAAIPHGAYEEVAQVDLNALKKWPYWPLRFDAVIVADVLEHVVEPERVLGILAGALAPGGRIVVSLPNVANFTTRFGLLLGRFEYTELGILDRTHLHLYTYASSSRLLRAAGLEVVSAYAGSDRFGRLLNGSRVGLHVLGGLLAFDVILVGVAQVDQV